jgi:hypothetical protein
LDLPVVGFHEFFQPQHSDYTLSGIFNGDLFVAVTQELEEGLIEGVLEPGAYGR